MQRTALGCGETTIEQRALIAIRRHAEQTSIDLALCGLNEVVHDLFEASGLLGSFHIYRDPASALAAVTR